MKKITTMKTQVLSFILLVFSFAISHAQDIAINEIMASNNTTISDEDGDFEDWIELYNYGATSVNLEGFGLTDDADLPFKWVFPSFTLAPNAYVLIWASNKDRTAVGEPLHTNFKISSGGEAILLTNAASVLVDEAPSVALDPDVSYGRQPNGTGPWLFFYTSTPNASNTGTGLPELLVPPTFSQASGLYTNAFDLTISHSNPDAVIVYTTDGSEPLIDNLTGTDFNYKNEYPLDVGDPLGPMLTGSYTSAVYAQALNIYDRSPEPDQLTTKNTNQDPLYTPINPVRKATVIKARAYVSGIASKIAAETFFVWSGGNPYNIPVLSLQIQENLMFDYYNGTYTSGIDFDTWRLENPNNTQSFRPEWNNYWRRGRDWEYPVNIQFFEPNGTELNSILSQNGGFRIHGNNSRKGAIKNLRFYARSEYDEESVFEYNIFDNPIPDATVPDNNEFKRILLRGDGSGGPVAYDVVFNRTMQPIFNGITRIKPVIHFINGEYWGLNAVRDRIDDHHYALNFDLDKDNVVIVDCKGSNCELDEGTDDDYQDYIDMRDFIINNDMTNPTLYNQVTDMLDMVSFIDHFVLEIFAANDSYERAFWKARVPENNGYGDGKWRLSVQDFEASLKDDTNWLESYSATTGRSDNNILLGNLLVNEEFKIQFINRFADVLNTVFTTTYFNNVVNQTFDEIEPYLAENTNRYPRDDFYEASEKTDLLDWGTNHPTAQRNQIKDYFTIANIVDLDLNVSSSEAGFVKISTITIDSETPGVPENPYPWTGKYFQGIPVTLMATALPGYEFSHWSGSVSGTDPILEVTPTGDMQIQANFVEGAAPPEVVYFWFMDGEISNNTPLEFLDATYASNALNSSIVYSSCLVGYPFNSDDPNWRKASFERKNSPTPLNYRPEANNDIPYTSDIMKGIQVKQPFRSGDLENFMEFEVPTSDFENIKLSFAVSSDGAAQTLLIDYWNGSEWSTANLANPSETIAEDYELKLFDFSNVTEANDNPDFTIRMRFDGADMYAEEGKEVVFNNIAIEGDSTLSNDGIVEKPVFKVFPNPTNDILNIKTSEPVDQIIFYNIYGQVVNNYFPEGLNFEINIEDFSQGIYLMRVYSNQTERTLKIIKN